MAKKPKKTGVEEFSETAISARQQGEVIEYDPEAATASAATVALESVETADTLAIEADWIAAQDELEGELGGAESIAKAFTQGITRGGVADRVVGTGIGFRIVGGLLTPEPALKVYVTEKGAAAQMTPGKGLPSRVRSLSVDVEEVGEIVPFSYARTAQRPVPCGMSIGHPDVTAGTLGCLVLLKNRRLCILSNNHVVANSNRAQVGDPCLQAGPHDGGRLPADRIGILEDFVRLGFPGPNTVDGGVVWTSFSLVSPSHVTYTLSPGPVEARLGMSVRKDGRTTQATIGTITDMSARINVPYADGVATFRDQIGIRGVGGVFSRGGDSGSLIVTLHTRQPICLLFAGRRDNTVTFANPIADVMSQLSIDRFLEDVPG